MKLTNKNTKMISALAFCMASLCTGVSTFAGYATTAPTLGARQDLATFGSKLGQRLAGVMQEVRDLAVSRKGVQTSTSLTTDTANPAVVVSDLFASSADLPQYFTDISTSPQSYAIRLLAREGVVAGQGGKFYPQNDARLYDFVKMAIDLYRLRAGYALSGANGLSSEGYVSGDYSLPSRYVATALQMGILSHVDLDTDDGMMRFQHTINSKDILQIMNNLSYISSGALHVLPLADQSKVSRAQAAQYLVSSFGLTMDGFVTQPVNLTDINSTMYQADIITLAKLGIIDAQANKFYPHNTLQRYDFLIMLVNTLLYNKGKTLASIYSSGYVSDLVDVDVTNTYAPWMYYAEDKHILDYLVVNKRGQDFLYPEQAITRHEVYTILSSLLGKPFDYDHQLADQETMKRDELAHLLVTLFDLNLPEGVIVQPEAVVSTDNGLVHKIGILWEIKKLIAKI